MAKINNQPNELKKKDKTLIVILFCIAIACVIGIVFIISPWGDGINEQWSQDDILSRYEEAEEAFNHGDLRQMQQILAQLQQLYPEEEANIEQFIADKVRSLPHVDAGFLMDEYDNNRVNAKMKYSNKLIVIQGEVISIGEDILGTTYILLDYVATDYSFLGVKCEFIYEEEIGQVAGLKKGDSVTVLGRYEDALLEPLLKECYIIDLK